MQVANAVSLGLSRPLTWLHFPVPRERTDAAYFAPLADLRLAPSTELYLGLIHDSNGAKGTRERIVSARGAIDREFGIATECGFGRRDPATVPGLLRLHADLADPVT